MGAAEALALKVLSIAPENARAHLCLGIIQIFTYRAAQGISELERALVINRNLAAAHAYIGLAKNFIGRGEETPGHIEDALRLSPRDTAVYLWQHIGGCVKVFRGKDEEAVAATQLDRGQPEFRAPTFLPRGRVGGIGSPRRSAARSERGAFHRSHIHHPPLSCRRAKRQPDLHEQAAAILRDHAQYWGPGGIAGRRKGPSASARRGCRRNEASLKAVCGTGCDARRLSTGRSIRA